MRKSCNFLGIAMLLCMSVAAMAFGPPQDVAPSTHYADYAQAPIMQTVTASIAPPVLPTEQRENLAASITLSVENTLKGWEPAMYAFVVDADGNEKPLMSIAREAALSAATNCLSAELLKQRKAADGNSLLLGSLISLGCVGFGWYLGRGQSPRYSNYQRPA
jgi:hypothetical protein